MVAAIIKGLILGVLLAISVGPIIFTILKQSITYGHKAGYCFVAGVSASDITMVVTCNFFTTLFAAALRHERAIAIAGSIFLLCMGIYTAFFKKIKLADENNSITSPEEPMKTHELAGFFFSGYLMNILNPGAILFWFAWSAAILADSKGEQHPVEYRFLVFGTCLVFLLATDLIKVMLAGKLRNKLTPKIMHRIDQVSGLILIGFGLFLVWSVSSYGNRIH